MTATLDIDPPLEHGAMPFEQTLGARWRADDPVIKKQVDALIYTELRRLANTYMRRERPNHTLQPTALVNEALTRVVGSRSRLGFVDQQHFYATAARVMRHVLVDHAKARRASKRGGGARSSELSLAINGPTSDGGIDMVELDEALGRLEELNAEAARTVELHYFAGLTQSETAELMGISVSSVARHIRFAKAWLLTQLKDAPG
jgi:RNA polymerase sigma factor (TIGR02999 family)